jgi:hypothetical protein
VDVLTILCTKTNPESEIHHKAIKILKQLQKDKYLPVYQPALEALVNLGEIDISEFSRNEAEKLYVQALKAIESKNPDFGYAISVNRFDDLLWDAYIDARGRLKNEELRTLLRLTLTHILKNRLKIENAASELKESSDFRRRSEILANNPELNWLNISWVIDDLAEIANEEDIIPLKEFLINPPSMWKQWVGTSDSISIAWHAANGLVRIGTSRARDALLNTIKDASPESAIIASLAYEMGVQQSKWKSSASVIESCRFATRNFPSQKCLKILAQIGNVCLNDKKVLDVFYKKFGIDKIREMARDSINENIDISIKLLKEYGKSEDSFLIQNILNDPKKSEHHSLAKEILKILCQK